MDALLHGFITATARLGLDYRFLLDDYERVPFVQGPGDHRFRRGVSAGIEFLDDAVELERGKIFVKVVIHLHRRRAGACADAFHFFQ